MPRHSVEAYDIVDMYGNVLYNGDYVRLYWGGGGDAQGHYNIYRYHILSISKRGKLSISGCANIVKPSELSKQSPVDNDLLDIPLKEYSHRRATK